MLIAAGLACLLVAAQQLIWTNLAGERDAQQLTRQVLGGFGPSSVGGSGAARSGTLGEVGGVDGPLPTPSSAPAGSAFAVLRVPRFGARWARPVLEGDASAQLDRGVGHVPGTAVPGAVGNAVVAGHRTTHGRPFWDVDRLRAGDTIDVETAIGLWRYTVVTHLVVGPDDRDVLRANPVAGRADGGRWLTLSACTPRFSARQRWIVHAELTGFAPRLP